MKRVMAKCKGEMKIKVWLKHEKGDVKPDGTVCEADEEVYCEEHPEEFEEIRYADYNPED